MLFAAFDYLQYKQRWGRFSHQTILKDGGILATREEFPRIETIKPGRIVFYSCTDSFQSWLIMYYTSSVWAHIATASFNGNIIDVTTSGVIEHPLSDYLDNKSYISVRRVKGMSDEQAHDVVEDMRREIGKGFNWLGVLRLYVHIILGSNASYRIRFSLDFIIVFLLLSPLAIISPKLWDAFAFLMALYLLVVVLNTPKRREMRWVLANQDKLFADPNLCRPKSKLRLLVERLRDLIRRCWHERK